MHIGPPPLDRRPATYIAVSAFVHLGILGLARLAPPPPVTIDGEPLLASGVRIAPPLPPPAPLELAGDGAPGSPAPLAMGLMRSADPDSPRPGRRRILHDEDALQTARERGVSAGLVGSTRLAGDLVASLTGTADVSSGLDAIDRDGTWSGDGAGGAGFGEGPRGRGPGGGGTIAAGPFGTEGDVDGGSGWGTSCGVTTCRHGMLGRGMALVPGDLAGTASDDPSCDARTLRRVVRKHLPRIEYCYERALLADRTLAGAVDTRFTILPDGHVIDAHADGLSPDLAACITTVLSAMRFPAAGATCQVRYPFHVRPVD